MIKEDKLALSHFVVAFTAFAVAIPLGFWQMWVRSPLPAPLSAPKNYYLSVTMHGVLMAYVLTTFFVMGFGYVIARHALGRPIVGLKYAWIGFWVGVVGVVSAGLAILAGNSSVLFTFYPPLTASVWFYLGIALVVVGSWFWNVLMVVNMTAWKRDHPGMPVPLAMFAITATAILWMWTTIGVVVEVLFQILPVTLGLRETIDPSLARMLFSMTLHAIVYFWLMPAYIAFYTLAPQAAGGRLFNDTMARVVFVMFLIFSMPVGIHHLLMDPAIGSGFKFLQSLFTFMIAAPTLITVFTITASFEVAGRLRGGKGLFGWLKALPWDRPMVLATGLSFLMLGAGGYGGLVNMSYQMNSMIHNTQWVTAHFHLIFGGTTVIMYMAIAYDLWPRLMGRPLQSAKLACTQLWLWFIGMLLTTLPWHITGLMGQPRRMAYYDYTDPANAGMAPYVIASVFGGFILLVAATLFVVILLRTSLGKDRVNVPVRFALALNPPRHVPAALNGFGVWQGLILLMFLLNYAYPTAHILMSSQTDSVGYTSAKGLK